MASEKQTEKTHEKRFNETLKRMLKTPRAVRVGVKPDSPKRPKSKPNKRESA
ncbi:hypothetical protein RFM98_08645 [Mesorhizobium sp. VK9D]|uniref:hypothetical protein n=1 Tax=Mesorhizobium australafricanum TaxID=3072311 RepID=UPI002A245F2D|nr:hypothetical protein [Mesorhizobium sp. VK9D]MDX8452822.1 hypothetical protein [Mesorhizobium sp. VK9D]